MSEFYLVFDKTTKQQCFVEKISDHINKLVGKNEAYFEYVVSPPGFLMGDAYLLSDTNELIKLDKDTIEELDKNKKLKQIDLEISEEKDRRIQTISAEVRSAFGKEGEKYYTGYSWLVFMCACDRICAKGRREKNYKTAAAVISNIDLYTDRADEIKLKIRGYTLAQLCKYTAKDDPDWKIKN